MRELVYSLALCAISAALEGVLAGRGIKQRFAELRLPRYSPPLWGWVVIGASYYVICFAVLYRLFGIPATTLRNTALALVLAILLANAFWNYFFFRKRSVLLAFVMGLPYSVVALALFIVLLRLDHTAALWWLPYLVYLTYANTLGYRLWKLNQPSALHPGEPAA
jgi:benzodiazapine receptor